MIWFELKKILNGRVLLCFVVIHLAFLMLFWTQNSSVQKGRNTAKQQEIYQKIGGRLTASTAKEIEELKQRKDAVLEEEAQKEDEYAQGKISVDEYMKYRDEYHMMNDKNEAIDMVYEKYETARKNGSWMIFDGYYDQLFRMDRTQWGLMLSVFLLIVLLVCCEPKELLATISVTREGRRGLWGAKLRTILMATLIFVILFARKIVFFKLSDRINTKLAIDTVNIALSTTVCHTDSCFILTGVLSSLLKNSRNILILSILFSLFPLKGILTIMLLWNAFSNI